MNAPDTNWCADPTRNWSMDTTDPRLSGGAPAPDSNLRTVAAASKAHGVPDGDPQRAGASPDVRMMRAAIPSERGEFASHSDVEIVDGEA